MSNRQSSHQGKMWAECALEESMYALGVRRVSLFNCPYEDFKETRRTSGGGNWFSHAHYVHKGRHFVIQTRYWVTADGEIEPRDWTVMTPCNTVTLEDEVWKLKHFHGLNLGVRLDEDDKEGNEPAVFPIEDEGTADALSGRR